MKRLSLIIFLFSITTNATVYQVGSTRTYNSPNALYLAGVVQDGDTIEIDAETYIGTAGLAVWFANDLIIKGIGGKPHLVANGEYIYGKGIWVLAGNNITVENIEFSGASVPDLNGAGIRLDGVGLTVRHCYFHDNENGILTSNPQDGDILIEFTEFNNNGYGDGQSHNLYIGRVNKLTFRYNYSHHAYIGHNLKSRANENYIYYNRIMDEDSGESSRLIDLPNGGFSIIMGNLLMQGNTAQNNNLVGYGLEGLNNTVSEIYYINNTAVNKRTASCRFIQLANNTTIANVTNNIFTGTGTIIQGTATTMINNIIETNIANLNFIDEPNYNYNLNANSPAVNAGTTVNPVNGNALTPTHNYVHPQNFANRPTDAQIDAGAYEQATLSTLDYTETKIAIYPNPFTDKITLKNSDIKASKISIFDSLGKNFTGIISIHSENNSTTINTSNLPKGIYVLKTESFSRVLFKR